MNILTKTYTLDSSYNFSFLVSIAIVSISMYFLLQNYQQNINIHIPIIKESSKIVSIVLTKQHIVEQKIKQKLLTKKIVKSVPVETKEPLPKITQKMQAVVQEKEITQKKVTPIFEKAEPIFDASKKETFIAGLYQLLNENKHYPKMARRRHQEGTSHIRFKLLKNGNLIHAKLYKSCGYSILDKAALKLVSNIKHYKPIPDVVSMVALNLNIPIKYSR